MSETTVQTLPGRFADVGSLQIQETVNARTRKFVGNGTAFLVVAGLVALDGIRIGANPIELTEKRHYPKDAAGQLLEEVQEPLISVDKTPDGRTVLLRSVLSNHGVWQKGEVVYVTGEWDSDTAEAEAKADTKPSADSAPPAPEGDTENTGDPTEPGNEGDNAGDSADDSADGTGTKKAKKAAAVVPLA